MNTYETTILVNAGLARADQRVRWPSATTTKLSAEWIELNVWEERKLCYAIKGETSALYLTGYFKADPLAIDKIERRVQLKNEIIRS